MKNQENKQIWVKPSVQVLDIKKDTFGGSARSNEAHSNPNGPQYSKVANGNNGRGRGNG